MSYEDSILKDFFQNPQIFADAFNHKDLLQIVEQDKAFETMNRQTVRLLNQVAGANISYTEQEESMDMNKALKDMIADAVKNKDIAIQEKEEQLQKKDSEIRQLHEQTLQRARKMLSDGLTLHQIIDYTGLTEQEIRNITI